MRVKIIFLIVIAAVLCINNVNSQIILSAKKAALSATDKAVLDKQNEEMAVMKEQISVFLQQTE